MKVHGPNRNQQVTEVKSKAEVTPVKRERYSSDSEHISVSNAARLWEEAHAPETSDSAKVANLKQAISDGSFQIDYNRIADRMLSEER